MAPLSGVVLAEGLRAHPEGMIPVAGALLTYCHLLPAVLWAGMLVYTARTSIAWRAGPAAARGLFRLYGTAAAWLFGIVLVTGVLSAVLLVPVGSLLTTTYGRFLVAKAALVAAAAALALASRAALRRPAPPCATRHRAPARGPAGDRRARRRTGRNRAAHRADPPGEARLLILPERAGPGRDAAGAGLRCRMEG